jgi:hypothetical protein
MNALLVGVDLVRVMLALARRAHPQAAAAGRSGVLLAAFAADRAGHREQGTQPRYSHFVGSS